MIWIWDEFGMHLGWNEVEVNWAGVKWVGVKCHWVCWVGLIESGWRTLILLQSLKLGVRVKRVGVKYVGWNTGRGEIRRVSNLPISSASIIEISSNWSFEKWFTALTGELSIMFSRRFISTHLKSSILSSIQSGLQIFAGYSDVGDKVKIVINKKIGV